MVADPVKLWTEFLGTRYHDKVLELAELYPDNRSLVVQFTDLSHFSPELADDLIASPKQIIDAANAALLELDLPIDVYFDKAHVRITNLPRTVSHKPRTIRADLRESLISVSGMVRSVSEVRPLMTNAAFQCQRCGYTFFRPQNHLRFEDQGLHCANQACDRGGPFKLVMEQSKFLDSQRITLVDPPEESRGTDAGGLDVLLLDDLIAKDEFSKIMLRPGDRVTINGILHFVQRSIGGQKSTQFDTWMEPISIERPDTDYAQVEITAEDEALIREISKDPQLQERLVASVAPSIYGMEDVKMGVLLQLFGSDRFTDPRDGRVKRGDIHLLMIGDPSVAKSEILNWVAENTPRCVYTSGKGSTTAGLTATAVKEDDRWVLSAGALVIANKGSICIAKGQSVLTAKGFVNIENVCAGTKVLSTESGTPKFNLVTSTRMNGAKEITDIDLYTGDRISVTGDHKVLTQSGWKIASDVTTEDYLIIPSNRETKFSIKSQDDFEKGVIFGFGLSDLWIGKKKNPIAFTASTKNIDRSQHMEQLMFKHYGVAFNQTCIPQQEQIIRGRQAQFGTSTNYHISDKKLHADLANVFNGTIDFENLDLMAGILVGILSTDTCISHKKGPNGVKHVIDIGLGRRSRSTDWLKNTQKTVSAIFHMFGILSVMRGRKLLITSLSSYNRVVSLFGNYLIGNNGEKLIPVIPKRAITSYDDILDDTYVNWFTSVPFSSTATHRHHLNSRIEFAIKKKRVTRSLLALLKPVWGDITKDNAEFKEPHGNYILNKVVQISKSEPAEVFDLSVESSHNFYVSGGVVHNCIDEIGQMNKEETSALHQAMEQQVVSVAKAGIVADLPTQCSVLAAGNPKTGRLDKYEPLMEQIGLPAPLFTRFDLVYLLQDQPEKKRDTEIAEHVLSSRIIRNGGTG